MSDGGRPLWGVGQWEASTRDRVPWEISHEEIRRDIAAAATMLDRLEISAGDRVLWCSMLSEAGQVWPFVVATMVRGAQLSSADATEAEAARVAMFCRGLGYRAVMGVGGAMLDGLDALGFRYADVLGGVDVLGARPDAVGRLRAAGLAPHHFALVGPAVAVGREPGGPAHVSADEWELEAVGGQVAVTGLAPRATRFARAVTACRGAVAGSALAPDVEQPDPRQPDC